MAIVVLTACFPQDRVPFLVGLALWGAACAFVATLLRNFAAYAAALAGYTAAIIAVISSARPVARTAKRFMLAVYRVSEICIGIVCAGIVLAGTDFGGARRRLAALFAGLSAEITGRFTGTLALAGSEMPETQPDRRELIRRVIALDPVIDEAIGESSQTPLSFTSVADSHRRLVRRARRLAHGRGRLARLSDDEARQDADAVLRSIPQELRSAGARRAGRLDGRPSRLRRICETAVRTLKRLPAGTPSLRLLADQTAKVLAGISRSAQWIGVACRRSCAACASRPWRPTARGRLAACFRQCRARIRDDRRCRSVLDRHRVAERRRRNHLGRHHGDPVVARADQAYADAMRFMIGIGLATVFAAIIAFAVLPEVETFAGFSLVIGLYLVPAGALMAQAMAGGDVYSHGGQFRAAARARKPDELRHRAIL